MPTEDATAARTMNELVRESVLPDDFSDGADFFEAGLDSRGVQP